MLEEEIPGSADEVVAWPSYHPNFVAGASLRRSFTCNKMWFCEVNLSF